MGERGGRELRGTEWGLQVFLAVHAGCISPIPGPQWCNFPPLCLQATSRLSSASHGHEQALAALRAAEQDVVAHSAAARAATAEAAAAESSAARGREALEVLRVQLVDAQVRARVWGREALEVLRVQLVDAQVRARVWGREALEVLRVQLVDAQV